MGIRERFRSRLYAAEITHARLTPFIRDFSYRIFYFSLDLSELAALSVRSWWFGYNRYALFSVWDKDYLALAESGKDGGSIEENLRLWLRRGGYNNTIDRVVLVTMPRFFHYVFNPVSFYYCYEKTSGAKVGSSPEGDNERLVYLVAEINNTFRERHVYLVEASNPSQLRGLFEAQRKKVFHVSPFHDMAGKYNFRWTDLTEKFQLEIDIVKDNQRVFCTRLLGVELKWSLRSILGLLVRSPLGPVLSMPRILWQAAILHYVKKLPVYSKPVPSSPFTIRVAPPTFIEQWSLNFVSSALHRMKLGSLTFILPHGDRIHFGNDLSGERATIHIHHYRTFWWIVRGGLVGFGEAYQKGYWSASDVATVVRILIDNRDFLQDGRFRYGILQRLRDRFFHRFYRKNSKKQSRRNISDHYDFGNSFFQRVLDPTLTYSCAFYEGTSDSLEVAQQRKIKRILELGRVGDEHAVLEIGSGWGGLLSLAVKEKRCDFTSVTLSTEQQDYVNTLIKESQIGDRARVELRDYRDLSGSYDRIISVEMLEAVGHEYLGEFFKTCARLLKPNGIVVLQVITMPESRYDQYRRCVDWIQKHVFPGACVPSLKAIFDAVSEHSDLIVEHVENIGPHYGPTLRAWRANLMAQYEALQSQGYSDEVLRTWEFYFGYCEAAFSTRNLGVHHIVLTRAGNKELRQDDGLSFEEHGYASNTVSGACVHGGTRRGR